MYRPLLIFVVALLIVSPVNAQAPNAAESELIALEHDWSTAWLTKDGAFWQMLYADEDMFTSESGTVYNKAQDITETISAETGLGLGRAAALVVSAIIGEGSFLPSRSAILSVRVTAVRGLAGGRSRATACAGQCSVCWLVSGG